MAVVKPRILAVLPGMLPTAVIYTLRPLSELARQGLVEFEYVIESKIDRQQLAGWDLAVFVRNDNSQFNSNLEELKVFKTKILYELDDNLWEVPHNSTSKKHHRDEQMRQVEHYLRCADMVKVYNPLVGERVRDQFNPKVYQSLAGIDTRLAPAEPPMRTEKKIQLVYATTRGAQDELYEVMLPDLRQILVEFAEQVELVVWRECHPALADLSNVRVLPDVADYVQFMHEFTRAGFDIGLAPMLDSLFYNSKTNTKFRDYGLARMAGIYSDTPVYRDVQDGVTGLVVGQEPGSWYRAIRRLVEDAGLRHSLQSASYAYICEHYRQEFMEAQWLEVLQTLQVGVPKPNLDTASDGLQVVITARRHTPDGLAWMECSNQMGRQPVDLSKPLPFADHSIDRFSAIESLETAENLPELVQEIYRVCRQGAVVSVLARYGQDQSVMADPGVRQLMNEHSFRFWTSAERTEVYEKNYAPDGPEAWGRLLPNTAAVDLRCIHLEFFYRPEYRNGSAEERRKARHKFFNVCDLMYACFIVVKQPVSEDDITTLKENAVIQDPPQVINRRYEEKIREQQAEIDRLQLIHRDKELELQQWKSQPYRIKANELLSEYHALRYNRWVRILLRFTDRTDTSGQLSAAYDMLKDSSRKINGLLPGYALRPGLNLQTVDFAAYPVIFGKPNLRAIWVAVRTALPALTGKIGVEVVSPAGKIVAQVTKPAVHIRDTQPEIFEFDPILDSAQGTFTLRIFARGVDVPVSVLEYQKYGLRGFGRLQRRPFVGLKFD